MGRYPGVLRRFRYSLIPHIGGLKDTVSVCELFPDHGRTGPVELATKLLHGFRSSCTGFDASGARLRVSVRLRSVKHKKFPETRFPKEETSAPVLWCRSVLSHRSVSRCLLCHCAKSSQGPVSSGREIHCASRCCRVVCNTTRIGLADGHCRPKP